MAARGARARKIVEKGTKKEETKQSQKQLSDSFNRVKSPRIGASTPASTVRTATARPPTAQSQPKPGRNPSAQLSTVSSSSSIHSKNSDTSSAVDKISAKFSNSSGKSKDSSKYASQKGRGTIAPRGRMGGVPMKKTEAEALESAKATKHARKASSRSHTFDVPPRSPPDSASTGSFEKSWAITKSFVGQGQKPSPFGGFEHDEDMWMEDGNCLIFFSEETDEDDPRPMLRVHTRVLEEARSAFISNLLRYGEIIPEEAEEDVALSTIDSPTARTSPTLAAQSGSWPLSDSSLINLDEYLTDAGPGSIDDFPRPPETPDIRAQRLTLQSGHSRMGSDQISWSLDGQTAIESTPRRGAGSIRVPPSIFETTTIAQDSSRNEEHPNESCDPGITHEIWFRAPSHIKRPDIQRRHHMATRNFLALLYGLPMVGNNFYEMLSDVQNIMDTYYELNEPGERWDSTLVIIRYLQQRQLDDARNDMSVALGLLAWAEQPNVNWDAGYVEAFVHAVGLWSPKTPEMREYNSLSQVTRHKLQNAYHSVQLKLIEVEERLERFSFEELWYVDGVDENHPAKRSFNSFREWLYYFYTKQYNEWPPSRRGRERWLTGEICQRLQKDFGSLYDYLVDRDITWDASEERPSRKWEMINIKTEATFEADSPGLPLTTMFIGFDSSQRYNHIPYPYPLLPISSISTAAKTEEKKKLFSKLKRAQKEVAGPDPKAQFQMALAFNGATNINRLGTDFKDSALIESFAVYEKTASLTSTSLQDARLGRWILLYGILSSLSSVSVSVSGLKFAEKAPYFLNASLDGVPPWRSSTDQPELLRRLGIEEATQQRSHCWQRAVEWERERLEATQKRSPAFPTVAGPLSPPPTIGSQPSSARSTPPPQQRAAIQQRQFQVQNYQSQSLPVLSPTAQATGGQTLAALKSELANLSNGHFQPVSPELEPYNIHPATLPPVNPKPRRGNISLYPDTSANPTPAINPNGVRTDLVLNDALPLRFKNAPDVPMRHPSRPSKLTPGVEPQSGGEMTPEFKDLRDDGKEEYFGTLPERRDVQ